jgi:hypothetical protein
VTPVFSRIFSSPEVTHLAVIDNSFRNFHIPLERAAFKHWVATFQNHGASWFRVSERDWNVVVDLKADTPGSKL